MATLIEKETLQTSRLNVRLAPAIKLRIARAASILGQDLTEFASSTLDQRAAEVLTQHNDLKLTEEECRFFLDFLSGESRKEPSDKLRTLAAEYKRGGTKGQRYEFPD